MARPVLLGLLGQIVALVVPREPLQLYQGLSAEISYSRSGGVWVASLTVEAVVDPLALSHLDGTAFALSTTGVARWLDADGAVEVELTPVLVPGPEGRSRVRLSGTHETEVVEDDSPPSVVSPSVTVWTEQASIGGGGAPASRAAPRSVVPAVRYPFE